MLHTMSIWRFSGRYCDIIRLKIAASTKYIANARGSAPRRQLGDRDCLVKRRTERIRLCPQHLCVQGKTEQTKGKYVPKVAVRQAPILTLTYKEIETMPVCLVRQGPRLSGTSEKVGLAQVCLGVLERRSGFLVPFGKRSAYS